MATPGGVVGEARQPRGHRESLFVASRGKGRGLLVDVRPHIGLRSCQKLSMFSTLCQLFSHIDEALIFRGIHLILSPRDHGFDDRCDTATRKLHTTGASRACENYLSLHAVWGLKPS